jgi:hypothetical protein
MTWTASALKKKSLDCPETPVTNYQSRLRDIPEKNEDLIYTQTGPSLGHKGHKIFLLSRNVGGKLIPNIY